MVSCLVARLRRKKKKNPLIYLNRYFDFSSSVEIKYSTRNWAKKLIFIRLGCSYPWRGEGRHPLEKPVFNIFKFTVDRKDKIVTQFFVEYLSNNIFIFSFKTFDFGSIKLNGSTAIENRNIFEIILNDPVVPRLFLYVFTTVLDRFHCKISLE